MNEDMQTTPQAATQEAFTSATVPTPENPKQPLYKKWWIYVIAVFGVLMLCGFISICMIIALADTSDDEVVSEQPILIEESASEEVADDSEDAEEDPAIQVATEFIGQSAADLRAELNEQRLGTAILFDRDTGAEIITASSDRDGVLTVNENDFVNWIVVEVIGLSETSGMVRVYVERDDQVEPMATGYQGIYDEYSQKIRDAAPTVSMSELAEIAADGVAKMAEYMWTASGVDGQYATYEEWAGKLMDVYMAEAR